MPRPTPPAPACFRKWRRSMDSLLFFIVDFQFGEQCKFYLAVTCTAIEISSERLKRHFRGRKTGWVRTKFCIGRVAHLQFKRATVYDVSMAEPDLIQRLAIEPDALNVFVVF